MSFFIYLLEVNLYLLAFYGFFLLTLKQETFFRFNRWYLLCSSLLSFTIPVIKLNGFKTQVLSQSSGNLMIRLNEIVVSATKPSTFSWFAWLKDISIGQYFLIVYIAGFAFLFIRIMLNLWNLHRLIKGSSVIEHEDYKEVLLTESNEAFSFMNYLFIGPHTAESIYKHELVHIRQKHSSDTLILEFIAAICWFNPIIYLYKTSLKTIHEFLADAEACDETNKYEYAELMVNNAFRISTNQLAHTFYTPQNLKTRLIMLQKNKSSKWAQLKYAFALPLVPPLLLFHHV